MCFVPLGTVCWLLNTSECAVLPFVERYMFDSFAYNANLINHLEHIFTYRSYGTNCVTTFFYQHVVPTGRVASELLFIDDIFAGSCFSKPFYRHIVPMGRVASNCCSSLPSSPARVFQNQLHLAISPETQMHKDHRLRRC